jgi:hypothetical protein
METSEFEFYNKNQANLVLIVRWHSGEQKYAVLGQLAAFASDDLVVTHEDSIEILRVTFVPSNQMSQGMISGLTSNGQEKTYTTCNTETHSWISLYYWGTPQPGHLDNTHQSVWNQVYNSLLPIPSGKYLLPEFFLATGFYFGGCGSNIFTDTVNYGVYGTAIGFLEN